MHIRTIGSYEAKTHLAALLDSVSKGEKVIITRKGLPVAILVPYQENVDSVADTIQAILQFRQGQSLNGLKIEDMKNDGRRY
jgi:prevent-host-death family protein